MREMLIFVDTKNNKNKFYKLELNGDIVNIEYGRVGANPQKTSYFGGEKVFNSKMKQKLRKGYIKSSIDLDMDNKETNINSNILEIAMEQILTDEMSKNLIKKLVQQNIHNITTQTKIKYDIATGYFKTPLGVITEKGVNQAIELLNKIESIVAKGNAKKSKMFIKYNERYFRIIPTKINNLREFENLLNTQEKISSQIDICESLIGSIKIIENEKEKQLAKEKQEKSGEKVPFEIVFEASLYKLNDEKEFKRIVAFFENSKNHKHGSHTNSYKIENIYKLSLGQEEKEYRNDLNNQMELFHGTKISNLLSILKSGLLMPKQSPGAVTGYMFGQGLYFSDQSTKSLNYCDGMYWNNSKKQDRIYMFIADIAMGNYKVPSGAISTNPPKGYNSYWAKPKKSGIQNNEMIIFNKNQIKLKYILEINMGYL
jgi:predicted DNA-binding WGR domain protein